MQMMQMPLMTTTGRLLKAFSCAKSQADSQDSLSKKQKITTKHSMIQVIMQAVTETTNAAIMAVREADNLVNSARPIHKIP